MHDFMPVPALIGGALIGLSASLLLFTHGKVAGISGLYGGVFRPGMTDRAMRLSFVVGLVLAGLLVRVVAPSCFATDWSAPPATAALAGLLVGAGTQVGNGCTSGHGVCGISRLSVRSIVATLVFMATGGVTVFLVRHVIGGAR